MVDLNASEKERWLRQINIPQFGEESQLKLKESAVLLCGVGGVGCSAAVYLVAAGIGKMILVDYDEVVLHNLNRQILYSDADLGKAKVQIAAERLQQLNPALNLVTINEKVGREQLECLAQGCSFVVDTFDRNKYRFAVNETCVKLGIAASHGFVQDLNGEVFTVLPGISSCLHCVMDESYPESENTPVIGVTAGLVGIQLATTAIKYLTGCGILKTGNRIIWDLAVDQCFSVPLARQPRCPVCSSF